MERIDQEQRIKKPIPTTCDPQARGKPDSDASAAASSWLGAAMAMWLQEDDGAQRAID